MDPHKGPCLPPSCASAPIAHAHGWARDRSSRQLAVHVHPRSRPGCLEGSSGRCTRAPQHPARPHNGAAPAGVGSSL